MQCFLLECLFRLNDKLQLVYLQWFRRTESRSILMLDWWIAKKTLFVRRQTSEYIATSLVKQLPNNKFENVLGLKKMIIEKSYFLLPTSRRATLLSFHIYKKIYIKLKCKAFFRFSEEQQILELTVRNS